MQINGKNYFNTKEDVLNLFDQKILKYNDLVCLKKDGVWKEYTVGQVLVWRATDILIDYELDKKGLLRLFNKINDDYDEFVAIEKISNLQKLCFNSVTNYGLSLCIDDLKKAKNQNQILDKAEIEAKSKEGFERAQVWDDAINHITDDWKKETSDYNPMKLMMKAGARVKDSQIRQLIVSKGLLTSMTGELVVDAVKPSLSDGLDPYSYYKTIGPARRGLANNFFLVPGSGYAERQLVTICRDLIITTEDCGSEIGVLIPKKDTFGRYLINGTFVDQKVFDSLEDKDYEIRSPITCQHNDGLCQKCCGTNPATPTNDPKLFYKGIGIGVVSAQTLIERLTQIALQGKHESGSVKISDLTGKVDNSLPDIFRLLDAAATTNIKVSQSEKDKPYEVEGDDYIEKAEILLSDIKEVYENSHVSFASIHYEIIIRGMSNLIPKGRTYLVRSKLKPSQYNLKKVPILGVRRTNSKHPSWLKQLGFGYTNRVLFEAINTCAEIDSLPSEKIMMGKLINNCIEIEKEDDIA